MKKIIVILDGIEEAIIVKCDNIYFYTEGEGCVLRCKLGSDIVFEAFSSKTIAYSLILKTKDKVKEVVDDKCICNPAL